MSDPGTTSGRDALADLHASVAVIGGGPIGLTTFLALRRPRRRAAP